MTKCIHYRKKLRGGNEKLTEETRINSTHGKMRVGNKERDIHNVLEQKTSESKVTDESELRELIPSLPMKSKLVSSETWVPSSTECRNYPSGWGDG